MKTTISLLFVLASALLTGQNYEPTSGTFSVYNGTGFINTFINHDSSFFQQRNFMLGIHWGPQREMASRLLFRQRDALRDTPLDDYVNNCDVFLKPQEWTHADG